MNSQRMSAKVSFLVNFFFFGIIILLVYLFFKFAFPWLLPFVIGLLISLSVEPAVRFLHKRLRFPRKLGSMFCVLFFVLALSFLLYLGFNRAISELKHLYTFISSSLGTPPANIAELMNSLSTLAATLPEPFSGLITAVLDNLAINSSALASSLAGLIGNITSFAVQVPNMLIFVIITLVSSYFISSDYPRIKEFIYYQIPERHKTSFFEVFEYMTKTLFRMLKSYIIIMSITFCELSLGFLIIGIDYAFILAAAVAVIDILPVLGIGTVLIPWALYSLIIGDYFMATALILLYGVITGVRQMLEPKIIGQQTGMYPLVTLMSIYIGLKLMGVGGMFLFPIIVITVKYMNDAGKIRLWR